MSESSSLQPEQQPALSKSMLEEVATVTAYNPDGWVTVEIELKSACNHCSSSDNCGTSTVAKAFSVKHQRFSLMSEKPCEVGDLLKLALPESVIIKAAMLVYIVPLIGLFAGATIGLWLGDLLSVNADYSSMIFAGAGGISAWFAGKRQAAKLEKSSTPVITAYLGQAVSLHRA